MEIRVGKVVLSRFSRRDTPFLYQGATHPSMRCKGRFTFRPLLNRGKLPSKNGKINNYRMIPGMLRAERNAAVSA